MAKRFRCYTQLNFSQISIQYSKIIQRCIELTIPNKVRIFSYFFAICPIPIIVRHIAFIVKYNEFYSEISLQFFFIATVDTVY